MRDVSHLMILLALKDDYEAVVVSLHSPSQTHSALLKWEIPTTVSNACWNRQQYLQEHAVCLHPQLLVGTEKGKQEQSYSSVGASVYFGIFHEETCQGSKPFFTTWGVTWKTALTEKVWVKLRARRCSMLCIQWAEEMLVHVVCLPLSPFLWIF